MVTHCYDVTLNNGPFQDTIVSDVSHFDYSNLLLNTPHQHQHKVVYHANNYTYHIHKKKILMSLRHLQYMLWLFYQAMLLSYRLAQITMSLCLMCLIEPDSTSMQIPSEMTPLFYEFVYIYASL